jgi:hypothetical protein
VGFRIWMVEGVGLCFEKDGREDGRRVVRR